MLANSFLRSVIVALSQYRGERRAAPTTSPVRHDWSTSSFAAGSTARRLDPFSRPGTMAEGKDHLSSDQWKPIDVQANNVDLFRTPTVTPIDFFRWLKSLVPGATYVPAEKFSQVLHGVTVHFRSGELAAIMGGSGSGKSVR